MTDHRHGSEGGTRTRTPVWVFLGVAVAATFFDQLSKLWAIRNLPSSPSAPTGAGPITLELIRNSGAAFSLGAGNTWIFSVLAAVIIAALSWWVASGRVQSSLLAAIVGLIAGGAVGNLIDRLVQPPGFGQGHVVDFINYNGWFIGNVADIWIVVGAAALAGYLLITDQKDAAAQAAAPTSKVGHADG